MKAWKGTAYNSSLPSLKAMGQAGTENGPGSRTQQHSCQPTLYLAQAGDIISLLSCALKFTYKCMGRRSLKGK